MGSILRRQRCGKPAVHINAEVYLSPTGSHDWLITNPEEFARELERFSLRL